MQIDPKPKASAAHRGSETLPPRIAELKARFITKGFRVNDARNTPGFPFQYSASKVRFDYVGFPTFVEEFFIFHGFDEVTTPRCHEFLDRAWDWAVANENTLPKAADLSKRALSLAMKFAGGAMARESIEVDVMSVRQVTCLIYVYGVAFAPAIAPDTLEWIWSKKSAASRKDAAQRNLVVPIIYDSGAREFHHFKKRPILGNVFYTEARKVMKKHLLE